MLTAGPMGSEGGACQIAVGELRRGFRSPGADDSVAILLAATVWSVSSRFADAVGALSPPAPRELMLVDMIQAVTNAELVLVAEIDGPPWRIDCSL